MNIRPACLLNFIHTRTVLLRDVSTNFNVDVSQPRAVIDATSFFKAIVANFDLSVDIVKNIYKYEHGKYDLYLKITCSGVKSVA